MSNYSERHWKVTYTPVEGITCTRWAYTEDEAMSVQAALIAGGARVDGVEPPALPYARSLP